MVGRRGNGRSDYKHRTSVYWNVGIGPIPTLYSYSNPFPHFPTPTSITPISTPYMLLLLLPLPSYSYPYSYSYTYTAMSIQVRRRS